MAPMRSRLLPMLLPLGFALAACGDDGGDKTGAASQGATTSTSSTPQGERVDEADIGFTFVRPEDFREGAEERSVRLRLEATFVTSGGKNDIIIRRGETREVDDVAAQAKTLADELGPKLAASADPGVEVTPITTGTDNRSGLEMGTFEFTITAQVGSARSRSWLFNAGGSLWQIECTRETVNASKFDPACATVLDSIKPR